MWCGAHKIQTSLDSVWLTEIGKWNLEVGIEGKEVKMESRGKLGNDEM